MATLGLLLWTTAALALDPKAKPTPAVETDEPGFQFGLEAAFVGAYGRVPNAGFGPAAHALLRAPSGWVVQLSFLYLPGTSIQADATPGQVDFSLWTLGLLGCAAPLEVLGGMGLCFGAEAGALDANYRGFSMAHEDRRDPVASLLLQTPWRLSLSDRIHLRVAITVGLPLVDRDYTYQDPMNDRKTAHEATSFALQGDLGLGVMF